MGPWCSSSKEENEAHKLELSQTQEMLKEAQKAHNEAVAKTDELLSNLLSGDLQTQFQWHQICCMMHEHELWAGVNGQMTTGRCPRWWTAFGDCLELHKLMVFTTDVAKRQQYFIQ